MLYEVKTGLSDMLVFREDERRQTGMDLTAWLTHGVFDGFQLTDGKDTLTYDDKEYNEFILQGIDLLLPRSFEPIDLNIMIEHFEERSKNISEDVRNYVIEKMKEYALSREGAVN
jgi:hypothetical protein